MCAQTLYLLVKLMLDVKVVIGVLQYRTEPKGAERETTLLSSLHDSGIDLLLTVASRVTPLLRVTLSSLIVVLGVLRLTRCSRCSYIIRFFSLDHECVAISLERC